MQIELGGEADEQELLTTKWQRIKKTLTAPAGRVYEFLVEEYSGGLTEIDDVVIAKHCHVAKTNLTKPGGLFDELEKYGLVDVQVYE